MVKQREAWRAAVMGLKRVRYDCTAEQLNLLQYSFCFMFWLFGCQACVISAPQSGIKLAPPVLEGEALTTTLPGKFQANTFQLLFQVPKMSLTTLKLPPPTPHL